jgi:polyisoprenoid-binding protein YceI
MSTETTVSIPGYLTGTWAIDPVHSDVSFVIRHLGVSKVRGRFGAVEGQIVTAENPVESTVTAKIGTSSIDTGNEQRDEHVRGEDFLDVTRFPEMTFTSTGLRTNGEDFLLDGELTLHGVSKPVTLELELNGFGDGFDGAKVVGFSAATEINRRDFGVTGGAAGAVLGDKVRIQLEIEAVKQA